MLFTGLAIFVLLILSGMFSGSETALTAASQNRMHALARGGDKRAAIVTQLYETRERLIGSILLGNNLVNILASSLATSVLITAFGEAGVVYATLGMTLLVLIFAEILPKTYAIRNSDEVALTVAPAMRVLTAVLAPVIGVIQSLVQATLHVFGAGLKNGTANDAERLAELRGAIELHATAQIRHEGVMLRSVLDLSEVMVGDIMTHRNSIVSIDAALPVEDIVDQVLNSAHTRIPLWRDDPDNVVGVIHAKGLLRAVRNHPGDLSGLNVMEHAAPPWFIMDTTPLRAQLHAFRRRREHVALVSDEYGALMGLVTLEDILEEIVGEIVDEHDEHVDGVVRQADGSFMVDGTVTIRDLNRENDWDLPDDNASTIAGLLLYETQRIPEMGQTFSFHGYTFKVLRRDGPRIASVKIAAQEGDAGSLELAS